MGKIALYICVLLVPLAGALEGTEGVGSTVQPTETSPEISRTPDGPATVTGFAPLSATLENEVFEFPSGEPTTDVSATSIDGFTAGTIVVFILIGLTICVGCYFSPWGQRLARRCTVINWSSTSSRDGDDNASLSSDQAEAPEDALNTQGLSSENQREPLVKFRRGRPGRPNDPLVSSSMEDVVEL